MAEASTTPNGDAEDVEMSETNTTQHETSTTHSTSTHTTQARSTSTAGGDDDEDSEALALSKERLTVEINTILRKIDLNAVTTKALMEKVGNTCTTAHYTPHCLCTTLNYTAVHYTLFIPLHRTALDQPHNTTWMCTWQLEESLGMDLTVRKKEVKKLIKSLAQAHLQSIADAEAAERGELDDQGHQHNPTQHHTPHLNLHRNPPPFCVSNNTAPLVLPLHPPN